MKNVMIIGLFLVSFWRLYIVLDPFSSPTLDGIDRNDLGFVVDATPVINVVSPKEVRKWEQKYGTSSSSTALAEVNKDELPKAKSEEVKKAPPGKKELEKPKALTKVQKPVAPLEGEKALPSPPTPMEGAAPQSESIETVADTSPPLPEEELGQPESLESTSSEIQSPIQEQVATSDEIPIPETMALPMEEELELDLAALEKKKSLTKQPTKSLQKENTTKAKTSIDENSTCATYYNSPDPMPKSTWNRMVKSADKKIHTTASNSNLPEISKEIFGEEECWPKLWSINPQFEDPYEIPEGSTIVITAID